MEVIVTGGRDYVDADRLSKVLDSLGVTKIIQGGANGADSLALEYAKKRNLPYTTYVADWDDLTQPDARIKYTKFGKAYDAQAGHRRNYKMLSENKAATVVAFPGGAGTKNCVNTAKELGMKIIFVA